MRTTLGERVKQALAGRSQAALARACGVKPPSVNDWVTGKTKTIEGAHLLNAASFLGVSPKWLAEGIGPRVVGREDERITHGEAEHVSRNETGRDDRESTGKENFSGVQDGAAPHQTIPTSMPYSAPNLKSTILLMGSLIGALDTRSRAIIGDMLKDLALHTDDAQDIAEKAAALATTQKPLTRNKALNKALRGRRDAVETERGPLEH